MMSDRQYHAAATTSDFSMLKRLVCSTFLCFASAHAQNATAPATPSFDCAKARGRVEKLICGDAQLAIKDRRVSELFTIASAHADDDGNLKRSQRRWLGDRDDCKEAACIATTYDTRIKELGDLTGKFSAARSAAVCEQFTDPAARVKALDSTAGADDINNDGVPDRASQCAGGTANIPCVAYADKDGKPLPIQPEGFEWITYSALGRAPFRFEERTFIYYANDQTLEQPAFISYVTPTNREVRICDFDTVVGSAVLEGGDEVCAALEAADERIESVEVASIAVTNAYAPDRPDTQARALAKIDIDNDGLEEDLVEFAYSSSAGRGCDINYFELLGEDGKSLANNSNAASVRELQGLSASGAGGRNCGLVSNRLIRFADKIYFEANAKHASGMPHELRILEGEAVAPVCTFDREIRTRIRTVY
jgi:uncharacterized protein